MKEFNLLINGRLTPGALTMNVVNPATGEAFAASPRADAKQLDAAVQAAKAAFPAWSRLNVAARRAVDAIVEDREVTERLFTKLMPRMKERPGGYTRVLKIGPRLGDGAPMVLVELVDR